MMIKTEMERMQLDTIAIQFRRCRKPNQLKQQQHFFFSISISSAKNDEFQNRKKKTTQPVDWLHFNQERKQRPTDVYATTSHITLQSKPGYWFIQNSFQLDVEFGYLLTDAVGCNDPFVTIG